jgi:hypothetical protein
MYMESLHYEELKGIDKELYEAVLELEEICRNHDDVRLKLELDYKLAKADNPGDDSGQELDEFTCWEGERLVGYLGIWRKVNRDKRHGPSGLQEKGNIQEALRTREGGMGEEGFQ